MAGLKSSLPNPPSLVENGNFRFIIFDAPNDDNLPLYITELKKHNVSHLVRACDPTYSTDPLKKAGIDVCEMPFPDGGSPADSIVNEWLRLLKNSYNKDQKETIAVHCVAGLGRAPVLVAIALIEGGMNPLEAVEYIRERRRGSINMKQLQWLKAYKIRSKKGSCLVM